ncbi:DUF3566 domain-containing protein [Actinokineospora globicatena]|uniref:DUF3566 domain-containing protein n=1 Tax=Actinokineospora globicatena TaxID=103729 RepID=A0A9W6V890_9PSEU|nr:DUF3566 domain-containing protein [Actinokineospora globicatena]MCP2301244.1 Transmembrane protein of unknown function (DUF3566) [Actinokineospora globicatena]GLW77119.1 hypothetical protein Aglo01_16010 [Actinokineospora globicatena]GLW83953.1 hypothetical protein Aglo02_15930 [Actinokineospora globicatena]GLW92102.1 hypothetical protein Aglo03_29180 [Actinokineospora globicatena]
MTQPEKPETAGQEEPERTSVIATTSKDAAQAPEPPDGGGAVEDNETTPPPWARLAQEEGEPESPAPGFPTQDPDPDVTQALPHPGNGHTPAFQPADEATISVQRPVVTGAAAPRLFSDPPPRTSVNLEGGAARAGTTAPPSALRRPGRGPRRANLQIKRFDPWSVLKLSLVLGVSLFFVWLVAVGALYAALDGMGVWDKVNGISNDLLNSSGGNTGPLISAGRVFGIAAIIGAINIVLFSALATVGAFVYNVSADLAGGLEVTLAERE